MVEECSGDGGNSSEQETRNANRSTNLECIDLSINSFVEKEFIYHVIHSLNVHNSRGLVYLWGSGTMPTTAF